MIGPATLGGEYSALLRRALRAVLIPAILPALLAGCQLGQPLRVIERGRLMDGRAHLALLPFRVSSRATPGKASEDLQAAADRLTMRFREALAGCPDLFLASPDAVQRAYRPPAGRGQEALVEAASDLAVKIGVSGVIAGELSTYLEREGGSWGARRPASVAFSVKLLRPRDGAVLWEAEFVEAQKPLSEDIGSLRRFLRRGARYLTASELAAAGAESVAESFCRYLGGS